MARAVGLAAFCSELVAVGDAELVIRNLRVAQVPGRAEVEIVYDLEGDGGTKAWVEVTVSEDGGRSFSAREGGCAGAVGLGVEPGLARRVVWTAGESWLQRERATLVVWVKVLPGPSSDLVWMPPGTFRMGSPEKEKYRASDEGPQTEVRLTQEFFLGKYEVTQGEWEAVMGGNPSHFKGDAKLPVEQVSWEDTMEYCRRLTERERQAGRLPEKGWEYRLPTEAQWEYACRAGTTTSTAFGDGPSSSQANFDGNYPYGGAAKGPYLGKTARVGSYAANAWGLHDMHGNVWEWCLDWDEGRLPGGSVADPTGPKSGSGRVVRGGSWSDIGRYCRSAYRRRYHPGYRYSDLGFRPALVPVP